MNNALEFTGERFVPGTPGEIWYEHWHRYHFAAALVTGRDVLDVACGEGYGSALLARTARHVVGADIAPAAVEHARGRYGATANLEFRQAECTNLPFPDASFDVVVSFETIEHIGGQGSFLDEVRRVLRSEGVLVLSCPNHDEYTIKTGVINEFHVHEPERAELAALLAPRFAHTAWYGQRPGFFSVVWPERGEARGEIFEVSESAADLSMPGHARPLYFIVIAGRSQRAIEGVVPRLSVLADRNEWVYGNYENVTRAYLALARELTQAQAERDALRAQLAAGEADRTRRVEGVEARQAGAVRHAGLPWWLALPLRRLRNALAGRAPGD